MKIIKTKEIKKEVKKEIPANIKYSLYKDHLFVKSFDNEADAIKEAKVLGVKVVAE